MGEMVVITYPDGSQYSMDKYEWEVFADGIKACGFKYEIRKEGEKKKGTPEEVDQERPVEGSGDAE